MDVPRDNVKTPRKPIRLSLFIESASLQHFEIKTKLLGPKKVDLGPKCRAMSVWGMMWKSLKVDARATWLAGDLGAACLKNELVPSRD
jgi:hypothetical protein